MIRGRRVRGVVVVGWGGGRTTDGVTVLVSTYGRNKKRIWT